MLGYADCLILPRSHFYYIESIFFVADDVMTSSKESSIRPPSSVDTYSVDERDMLCKVRSHDDLLLVLVFSLKLISDKCCTWLDIS